MLKLIRRKQAKKREERIVEQEELKIAALALQRRVQVLLKAVPPSARHAA